MLWPFFEGNQRSIKCIAAYIESFPCGKLAGYKLERQRCIKSSSRSKGMFLAQNTALSPWSVYKVSTGSPLYKRKGCPLHRELYMGGYIIIIYSPCSRRLHCFQPSRNDRRQAVNKRSCTWKESGNTGYNWMVC